jgi:hypothetical protein
MLHLINVVTPIHHLAPNSQPQKQQVNSPLVDSTSNIQNLGIYFPLTPNNEKISNVFTTLSLVDDIIHEKSPLHLNFLLNSKAKSMTPTFASQMQPKRKIVHPSHLIKTIEGKKISTLNKHYHCAHKALIAQDIMVDLITMAKLKRFIQACAHVWHLAVEVNLQVLTKTKHGSLQLYLKEGRQVASNGYLKSKQKLMVPLTNIRFALLLKDIFKFLVLIIQKHFQ